MKEEKHQAQNLFFFFHIEIVVLKQQIMILASHNECFLVEQFFIRVQEGKIKRINEFKQKMQKERGGDNIEGGMISMICHHAYYVKIFKFK